jgi:hypothetical protein
MAKRKNKPKTAGYKPVDLRWMRQPRDLPIMTWLDVLCMLREPVIRLGLAMRAAPLATAEFAYKKTGSDEWTPGIHACNEVVAKFVLRQFKTIWSQLDAITPAQTWGWAGSEVIDHKTLSGMVEVAELLPRHANDVRAITYGGRVGAVRFLRIDGETKGHIDLAVGEMRPGLDSPRPKAIFHSFQPDAGAVYGTSILEGAYSPWCDKWLKGGALDVRRLAMLMYSFSGRKIYYPDGNMEVPGYSEPVPNSNIARQMGEQIMAGAPVFLPSDIDPTTGKQRWLIEEAEAMTGLADIREYPKDLDTEMLRGMEIPDDVVTSQEGKTPGAWSGKAVPQLAFYTGLDRWGAKMVRDIRYCYLDWLVAYNFGPGAWYEATLKPLAEQAMEKQGAEQPGQGGTPRPQPQPQPAPQQGEGQQSEGQQRMSLEDGEAAAIVKAVRGYLREREAA